MKIDQKILTKSDAALHAIAPGVFVSEVLPDGKVVVTIAQDSEYRFPPKLSSDQIEAILKVLREMETVP